MLTELIWQPDSFAADPLGWIGNQSAYVLIVGVLLLVLFRRAWVGLTLYALWETWHWVIYFDAIDSLTDWAFVASGMLLADSVGKGDRKKAFAAYAGIIVSGAVGVFQRV